MPIWATVSPTGVSTAHTPPLEVTTTLESVTPRPSPMPIWATVSPTAVSTAHTPPLAVTTTLESVTPRPSPMPIWATVSPEETQRFGEVAIEINRYRGANQDIEDMLDKLFAKRKVLLQGVAN